MTLSDLIDEFFGGDSEQFTQYMEMSDKGVELFETGSVTLELEDGSGISHSVELAITVEVK